MVAEQLLEHLGLHNRFLYEEMCTVLSEPEAALFHPHNTGEGYEDGSGEGQGCFTGDGRNDGSCWSLEEAFPAESSPYDTAYGEGEDDGRTFEYSTSHGGYYIPVRA